MVFRRQKSKKGLENIFRVYIAQFFSLISGLIISLYVPKVIGILEFSYWQLFLFYASYTGILQLGLNDGLYLRYGGKVLSTKERAYTSGQLWMMLCALFVIAMIVSLIISLAGNLDTNRRLVLIFVAIYAIVFNGFGFCSTILQALNKFKLYSTSVMIEKMLMIISIIVIGIFKLTSYKVIIICYIFATVIGDIIFISKEKSIFLARFKISKNLMREIRINIFTGSNLMISNIASTLIIGICRFFISSHFPITTFGYVSFSLSLCAFCLLFISQSGTAIYPLLKMKSDEFQMKIYISTEIILNIVLPVLFIVYLPCKAIIQLYLPNYLNSLLYFAAVLPICIFEAKISILYSTFMKVLRLEKKILQINLIIFFLSLVASSFGIYILENIPLTLSFVSILIMLKALLMRKTIEHKQNLQCNNILTFYDYIIASIYYVLLWLKVDVVYAVLFVTSIATIYIVAKRQDIKKNLSYIIG